MTPKGSLIRQVDAWTALTVQASRHLARLYRRLGDDKQASAAIEIMIPSEERARRLNIRVPVCETMFDHLDEITAEALAWEILIEAQAGFCAFHAIIDGPRAAKRIAERSYRKALRGLQTAFPEPIAEERHSRAISAVSLLCADLFIKDLGAEGSSSDRESLHSCIQESIRNTFLKNLE